nr:hypothetical protein [Tanacetum cinerariifolium]
MLSSMVNKEVNKIAKSTVPIYVAEGLLFERQKTQDDVAAKIVEAIQKERENLRAEVISQVNDAIANHIPPQVDSFLRNYMSNNILHVHPTQTAQATAQEQQYQLYLTMKNDDQLQQAYLPIWLYLKIKFEGITATTSCRPSVILPRDHDNYQDDDARPKEENSVKRQKTSEHGTYSVGESSSGQAMDQDQNPSGSCTQEQLDEFDSWMEDAETDEEEVPDDKILQELVEEMSGEIDEAKLQKAINEMVRQRCNSGDEHQYHLDQMQNYLKNDIVWESRKERLTLQTSRKKALVKNELQGGLINISRSLMCMPDIVWNIVRIYRQSKITLEGKKKLRDNPHEVFSKSKIVKIIKTSYEIGHEYKFITEIIVRRFNGEIKPITEPDYKYLNKNDMEDMYLLCINDKLGIESYQHKVNLTAPTISFSGIEESELFNIVSELVCGMIYENSKKEKRVMVHKEIHKLCDATLKRVLEKLKKYNKNVKYGYANPSPNKDHVELL